MIDIEASIRDSAGDTFGKFEIATELAERYAEGRITAATYVGTVGDTVKSEARPVDRLRYVPARRFETEILLTAGARVAVRAEPGHARIRTTDGSETERINATVYPNGNRGEPGYRLPGFEPQSSKARRGPRERQ